MRSLARQETQLDGMRSRAGILLSAAAIATSFCADSELREIVAERLKLNERQNSR